jgi:hypothetical protein
VLGLLYIGSILIILSAAVFFINKLPLLGKLPGDILIQKKNFTFFLPLTSMLVLSALVALVLKLLGKP